MNKIYAFQQMLRIRMIEEAIAKRYPKGQMRCPVHLSVGQEAQAVGVVQALRPQDKMVSTHRGHAHYLAKGGSLNGLIGELYGKSSGCSKGNGGSMHLIDLDCNFYGSTSIVGGTIPVGVGLAFADYLKGDHKTYTVVCIGDAAIEEGVFHEAANFASLHKLNVLFACENNFYSCYTDIKDRQPERRLYNVAQCHKITYAKAENNDLDSIYKEAKKLMNNGGVGFLEMPTYRHLQHCGPDNDDNLGYRSEHVLKYWHNVDPLKINIPPNLRKEDVPYMAEQIHNEIIEAFKHAEKAPFPEKSEIGKYVYANT